MEKSELLNILYSERQRVSEKNKDFGWSIWVLIGTIATLLWVLVGLCNSNIKENPREIFLFSRSFCTMLFSLLLFVAFYKKRNYVYYADRFVKSSGLVPGIVDIVIPILLIVSYSWPNLLLKPLLEILNIKSNVLHENPNILDAVIIPIIFATCIIFKFMELCFVYKIKQKYIYIISWLYLILSILMLFCAIIDFRRTEGFVLNVKFSLVISGMMATIYILKLVVSNPLRILISSIDRLIDKVLIDKEFDINNTYEKFISVKIGYKYSQLYQKDIQKIHFLISLRDSCFNSIPPIDQSVCEKKPIGTLLQLLDLLQKALKYNKKILKVTNKMNKKIAKGIHQMTLNDNNLKEIDKLSTIINDICDGTNKSLEKTMIEKTKIENCLGKYEPTSVKVLSIILYKLYSWVRALIKY